MADKLRDATDKSIRDVPPIQHQEQPRRPGEQQQRQRQEDTAQPDAQPKKDDNPPAFDDA